MEESSMVTWGNQETETIAQWLDFPENKDQLSKLVDTWNELQLLGVDLADQIRVMCENTVPTMANELVDWNELAEHYALDLVGVDEDELTRRRIALGGTE